VDYILSNPDVNVPYTAKTLFHKPVVWHVPPKPTAELSRQFPLRGVLSNPSVGSYSQSNSDFYDYYNRAKKANATMKRYAAEGKDIAKYQKENPLFATYEAIYNTSRQLAEIDRGITIIRQREDMSPSEKQLVIRDLETVKHDVCVIAVTTLREYEFLSKAGSAPIEVQIGGTQQEQQAILDKYGIK
jgi:hypothetical protein